MRKLLIFGASAVIFSSSAVLFNSMFSSCKHETLSLPSKTAASSEFLKDNQTTNTIYSHIASSYDDQVNWDECITLTNWLRRKVLREHAHGKVLEIAVGTGRNFPYYPYDKMESLTLVEQSNAMMQQIYQKVKTMHFSKEQTKLFKSNLFAVEWNLHELSQCKILQSQKFDTIVDTFGLCSFENPVLVLQEVSKLLSSNENSRIVLIEHGKSKRWNFVNSLLESRKEAHFQRYGCIWNKDIEKIVHESGLEIEKQSVHQLGTVYVFVLKRPKNKEEKN